MMSIFTSSREKRFWLLALVILVVISSTLFIEQPFAVLIVSQGVQAIIFLSAMVFVGISILAHSLRTKPDKVELAVIFGLLAIYIMFYFRLGAYERSHLIEYSVLAIAVHKALIERKDKSKSNFSPAFITFVLCCLIGAIDEYAQLFIPNRTYDPVDIVFNCMVIAIAIISRVVIIWIRNRLRKAKV